MLPLIRNNPSCLDVKNADGVTARQLLQDFADRLSLSHGQHHYNYEVCVKLSVAQLVYF